MNPIRTSLRVLISMIILTGILYPLFITFVAQMFMPDLAGGSLLYHEKKVIGSRLIAQSFTKEIYFWPRPSAIDYDPMKPSGGSNLSPNSRLLHEIVAKRIAVLRKAHPYSSMIPADLVYASGSGLDPHIHVWAAYFQMERIVKARGLLPSDFEKIANLIDNLSQKKMFLSQRTVYVNVLLLNEALNKLFPVGKQNG